jgi:predicted transcriptional regulator
MKLNSKHKREKLTALEQLVMDYVWSHPDCTADACREGLADERSLKDSTIRTVLRHLEEKGYIDHTVDGRTFVYRAVESPRNVAVGAVAQLIDKFCGGSVEELLVGMVDNRVLDADQLQKLALKIKARKEKKG